MGEALYGGGPFAKEAFPGGGRWHGNAVTDEVAMDLPRTPSPKSFDFIIYIKKEAFLPFGGRASFFAFPVGGRMRR